MTTYETCADCRGVGATQTLATTLYPEWRLCGHCNGWGWVTHVDDPAWQPRRRAAEPGAEEEGT